MACTARADPRAPAFAPTRADAVRPLLAGAVSAGRSPAEYDPSHGLGFDDLRRFCAIDGWEELERVRGGTGHHRRYRKILRDGTILRTKVSNGGGEIRDARLWGHIWRDQLGLASEEQFWHALPTGEAVARADAPAARPEGQSIPGWVVAGLLRAGVREDEIRELDVAGAQARLEEIWSHPPDVAE